jgi:hypothetical protein
MEIEKSFSITDFLAYLFPGVFGTTSVFVILILTPLQPLISQIPLDIVTGVLFLAISYPLGVIFSGFSGAFIRVYNKITLTSTQRNIIPLTSFQVEVQSAFNELFHITDNRAWSSEHYSACRALISQFMPAIDIDAQRQNALRQLRRNLVFPIILWFLTGLAWGRYLIYQNNELWGFTLVATSLIIALSSLITMLDRMHKNDQREMQKVLIAFLVGYKMNIFTNNNIK